MFLFDFDIIILSNRIIVFVLGLILNTFGISLYISAELINGPIDQLMINISNLLHKNISWGKTIMECLFFLLILLVHGPFGFGTIVVTLSSGYLVNYFYDKLQKERIGKVI